MTARDTGSRRNHGTPDPCTIVIFGASGDLTSRKLIPALFAMYTRGRMPSAFSIVGCSRSRMTSEGFRQHLLERMSDQEIDRNSWADFAENLYYHPVTYERDSFQILAAFLRDLDQQKKTGGNRMFDLAVPPALYPVIGTLLGSVGLADEEAGGWSRIIVEKPFGRDLDSAVELNNILHVHFNEEQIFRIDHYLAKETVQNTLILRFANSILEPVWNRHYIEYVGIVAAEELGVGNRAGYYEQSGVLRDMFQNHLMQLLVLTAMEPPSHYEADAVQDEKAKVIRCLREFNPDRGSRILLGQYGEGRQGDIPLPGYRSEPGVAPDSATPTFALMKLFIDNWRWQDVPFYMVSGKRLKRKETRIVIQFREVPHRLFEDVLDTRIRANRLVIETFPEEAVRLHFQTKDPGTELHLRPMTMDFAYSEHYTEASLDAYARVLLDGMTGDHMLFWRQDGIELSWSFLTPVLEQCEECRSATGRLHPYPAGTWGPPEVREVMHMLLDD